jgi:hypothetical protein
MNLANKNTKKERKKAFGLHLNLIWFSSLRALKGRSDYIVGVFFFFGEVWIGEAIRCSVSLASFSAAALRFSLIWPGT